MPPKGPTPVQGTSNGKGEKAGRRSCRNRRHERKKASAGTIVATDGQFDNPDDQDLEESRQSINHNLLQSANHKKGSMTKMYQEEQMNGGLSTSKRQMHFESSLAHPSVVVDRDHLPTINHSYSNCGHGYKNDGQIRSKGSDQIKELTT